MAKKNYVPQKKQLFRPWHNRYKAGLHTVATKYGITAAQLAKVDQNDIDVNTDFDDADTKDRASKAANSKTRQTQSRADKDVRSIAQQIKNHPSYSEQDGILLDIIGADSTLDPATVKPVLTLSIVGGRDVQIDFVKQGFTGVKISSKRGNESAFTFLTIDTESPYVDNRPNLAPGAETRQYQGIYMDADHEVGLLSDVTSIAVMGQVSAPGTI